MPKFVFTFYLSTWQDKFELSFVPSWFLKALENVTLVQERVKRLQFLCSVDRASYLTVDSVCCSGVWQCHSTHWPVPSQYPNALIHVADNPLSRSCEGLDLCWTSIVADVLETNLHFRIYVTVMFDRVAPCGPETRAWLIEARANSSIHKPGDALSCGTC